MLDMSVIKNTDMKDIVTWINEFMVEKTGMPAGWANMLDETWRGTIARGIADGIDAFFAENPLD